MIVKQIELYNFRCHQNQKINFEKQKTAIIGLNGKGKTSILESIYYLATGKSLKDSDNDLIKHNQPWFKIKGNFDYLTKSDREVKVVFDQWNKKNKTFVINLKEHKRLPIQSKVPVVTFLPDDLNLISGSPRRRRRYFDNFIGNISPTYSSHLNRYEKILKQRNDLVREKPFTTNDELFSWNVLLSRYGGAITKNRLEIIDEINLELNQIYQQISATNDILEIKYSVNYQSNNIEQEIFGKLNQLTQAQKFTIAGPHRDDFELYFNNKIASKIASRGEIRSILLALKLVEIEIIKNNLKHSPIILLDDVLSELDINHQKSLMNFTNDSQIILTSTNVAHLTNYQIIQL